MSISLFDCLIQLSQPQVPVQNKAASSYETDVEAKLFSPSISIHAYELTP